MSCIGPGTLKEAISDFEYSILFELLKYLLLDLEISLNEEAECEKIMSFSSWIVNAMMYLS